MLKKTRSDGTYIKDLPAFTKILPFFMETRLESSIYFEEEFDVTHARQFIREYNAAKPKGEPHLSFFHVFLCTAARTVVTRPKINRFVSGHRYYQRNQINLNFVAKKEMTEEGEEINVKIPFSPYETLETVLPKVNEYVERSRGEEGNSSEDTNVFLMKLPRPIIKLVFKAVKFLDYYNLAPASLIDLDPFYCTAFITNVGSIGIDAPLHHLYEWGTCGMFIALGRMRKVKRPNKQGELENRVVVNVNFTYDDRISEGMYIGRAINVFKDFCENPEKLIEPPEVSDETLRALQLKEYPPKGS
jgi:hypothetical protein